MLASIIGSIVVSVILSFGVYAALSLTPLKHESRGAIASIVGMILFFVFFLALLNDQSRYPNRQYKESVEELMAQPINVNTASRAYLETVPGIGPITARHIIRRRPFASIEEVRRLPVVRPENWEKMRRCITVDEVSDDAHDH